MTTYPSDGSLRPMVIDIIDGRGQLVKRTVIDGEVTEPEDGEPWGVHFSGGALEDDLGDIAELIEQGCKLRIWPTNGWVDMNPDRRAGSRFSH